MGRKCEPLLRASDKYRISPATNNGVEKNTGEKNV